MSRAEPQPCLQRILRTLLVSAPPRAPPTFPSPPTPHSSPSFTQPTIPITPHSSTLFPAAAPDPAPSHNPGGGGLGRGGVHRCNHSAATYLETLPPPWMSRIRAASPASAAPPTRRRRRFIVVASSPSSSSSSSVFPSNSILPFRLPPGMALRCRMALLRERGAPGRERRSGPGERRSGPVERRSIMSCTVASIGSE